MPSTGLHIWREYFKCGAAMTNCSEFAKPVCNSKAAILLNIEIGKLQETITIMPRGCIICLYEIAGFSEWRTESQTMPIGWNYGRREINLAA